MVKKHPVTRFLERTNPVAFSSYAIVAAFLAYFSMYAFRKPYSVALYKGQVTFLGMVVQYKILLLVLQVFGYMLSKFSGIKVISEMPKRYRMIALFVSISVAELALLLFALIPKPYNVWCLFLNGIPLGMVWGLVFSFLEGRKLSELLGAGLSASYIVASGVVKSVGETLMEQYQVSEFWMPFAVGALFFPLFVLCVYGLSLLPEPTAEDEALRMRRKPMQSAERWSFFLRFWPGLVALIGLYMLLTAYRDFRDNFSKEIWVALGVKSTLVFTQTEMFVAFGVLVALALIFLVKDNQNTTCNHE
ncbi:MAG: DUF5690 family protein, partial [Myxococcota bacterium]